mmetsp:Transcript_1279/g.2240  ORF Transcript_1279/g.2240 Transcript_1279/m.2240 type:complete len:159 (+) Transcript_1279:129-605(+)
MSAASTARGGAPPLVGLGYVSEPISGATAEALWQEMCVKIKRPQDFLPVINVLCEDRDGATGLHVWRTMDFTGPGPMHGKTIVEHIYADETAGEIRFVVQNDSTGSETDTEVVNVLLRDPLRIEYCMRSVASKERKDWKAPLPSCVIAINLTIQKAQQ